MLWETFPGKEHVTKPGTIQAVKMNFVGKKAQGRISKRILQKNKARKRACVHQGKEILTPVLRFILLPYYHQNCPLRFRNNVIFRRKIWDIITISVPFMLKIPNTNPFDLRGFCTFIYQLFVRRFALSWFYLGIVFFPPMHLTEFKKIKAKVHFNNF